MKVSDTKYQISNKRQKYTDLEARMSQFGIDVVRFCKTIPENTITRQLISQLVRSATSIGANYSEANNASSHKDFRNKVYICKKEAQESKYWLNIIKETVGESKTNASKLWQECHELCLILQSIANKLEPES